MTTAGLAKEVTVEFPTDVTDDDRSSEGSTNLGQGAGTNLCLEEELTSFYGTTCKIYQVHTSHISSVRLNDRLFHLNNV